MDSDVIFKKFGAEYIADERTFTMGINQHFTFHFAERFKGLIVLETCTGGGFTTLALARVAKHVFTVEIDQSHQKQAISNIKKAGLSKNVSFIHGSITDQNLLDNLPSVDAAFLDPDWAVTGPNHVYRFIKSNTQPPADTLLNKIFEKTKNIAIVLPQFLEVQEFDSLPENEREKLFLDESHELYCLYFGNLIRFCGETEFHVPI
ncbi:MAG: methyltransferase domain-containing protein [Desulfobacteraceae bacterium]|nr:methyltransferase domain-containing protein [Desulfobacteraceae bacterium]